MESKHTIWLRKKQKPDLILLIIMWHHLFSIGSSPDLFFCCTNRESVAVRMSQCSWGAGHLPRAHSDGTDGPSYSHHDVEHYPLGQSDATLNKWKCKAWACATEDLKFVLQNLNVPFLLKHCSSRSSCWIKCVLHVAFAKLQCSPRTLWPVSFEGWLSLN